MSSTKIPPPTLEVGLNGVSDPLDVHVGNKIKVRRQELRMSQKTLSEEAGLPFEQLQSYEHGLERLAPDHLFSIAEALDVQISFLFEGSPVHLQEYMNSTSHEEISKEEVELATAYYRIKDFRIRKKVLDLAKQILDGVDEY